VGAGGNDLAAVGTQNALSIGVQRVVPQVHRQAAEPIGRCRNHVAELLRVGVPRLALEVPREVVDDVGVTGFRVGLLHDG
jgi:hypothetical protein